MLCKYYVVWVLFNITVVLGRIHNIKIESDRRDVIPLANFGLTTDGSIEIIMESLIVKDSGPQAFYGIVIEVSDTVPASQYSETHIDVCNTGTMDMSNKHPEIVKLQLEMIEKGSTLRVKQQSNLESWDYSTMNIIDYNLAESGLNVSAADKNKIFAVNFEPKNSSYSFHIQLLVEEITNEGQYTIYFYRCSGLGSPYNYHYTFLAKIIAKNGNSYLSAGEKPLIFMYMAIGVVYMGMAWLWFKVMVYHSENLFKIHYFMAALVCAKFIAAVLHSIDYYFISSHGTPDEAWAILWYIIHLVRGLLLFISLALIGMGFAFVKHVLSANEKLVLMSVVPLQVIANVAYVIIDSNEESDFNYGTWKKILIFVDLLCCGAIIFPVMWSIRHLQQATERSDNKTTLILSQLKLFRHFYVLVVVYIYITRIALKFMEVVVPFKYTWGTTFLFEFATICFFTVTGWKFRPYISNPYYKIVEEEDDLEMEAMIVDSETLRNRSNNLGDEEETLA